MSSELSTQQVAQRIQLSPPTVRKLLVDGLLVGRRVQRGTRFSWLVTEESVEAYVHARSDSAAGGVRRRPITMAQLRSEIVELRELLDSLLDVGPGRGPADLRTEIVQLRSSLLQQRAITAALLQADEARAEVVQHLLDAVAAGEIADQRRREALTAAEEIVGQFVTPGHAGDLE